MPSKPCFSTAKIRNLYRFQPKQEGNEPIETFGICELSLNDLSHVVTVATICHTSHAVTHVTIVTDTPRYNLKLMVIFTKLSLVAQGTSYLRYPWCKLKLVLHNKGKVPGAKFSL